MNRIAIVPKSTGRDLWKGIAKALHRNAALYARHIDVTESDGVVTLKGTATSWLQVFGSRAWGFTLGVVALAYGAIGVEVLGVVIDASLIAGALLLLAAAALLRRGLHRGAAARRDDQDRAVRVANDIL